MLIGVQVQEQCVSIGLIPVLAGLLTTKDVSMIVITHSATILTKLAGARGFPEDVQKHGVYAALVHAITNATSYDVLTTVRTTFTSVVLILVVFLKNSLRTHHKSLLL